MGPASEATTANDWQGARAGRCFGLRSGVGMGVPDRGSARRRAHGARRPRVARGEPGAPPAEDGAAVTAAADWLAAIQQPDGSLGVSARPTDAGVDDRLTPSCSGRRWRVTSPGVAGAASWLLRQKGTIIPAGADPDRVLGHDTTLVGWPWVDGTHSWLEPTVLAVLALGARASAITRGFRGPQGDPRPRGRDRRLELRQQVGLRPGPPRPSPPRPAWPCWPWRRSGGARKSSGGRSATCSPTCRASAPPSRSAGACSG